MVSAERIEEILKEEIQKAEAAGIRIHPISPHIQFPKAVSFYGMCHKKPVVWEGKSYPYYIRISEYYRGAEEGEIRETVMHEVLHAAEGAVGHGPVWKSYAAIVNRRYGYHIQRVGGSHFDLRTAAGRNGCGGTEPRHKLICLECGTEILRQRRSRLTMHPERYRCRCGGKLKLLF